MSLTNVAIRAAKPREKAYKLADEKGLFLFITPSGGKYWRLKYRFAGKEKKLAFGVYPEVSLAEAREKRDQARNRDAIERQLAHAERNNIRAAYNYAEYLPERRKMMQHWADYLDTLVNNTNMVSLKTA